MEESFIKENKVKKIDLALWPVLIASFITIIYQLIFNREAFLNNIPNLIFEPSNISFLIGILSLIFLLFRLFQLGKESFLYAMKTSLKHILYFFIGNFETLKAIDELKNNTTKVVDELKVGLGEIKKPIHTCIENNISVFASRFFFMDKIKENDGKVGIYFSHRGDTKHSKIEAAKNSSSIPLTLEESNLTMKFWNMSVNCLGIENVRLSCSCEEKYEYKHDYINNKPIPPGLKDNLILFGSNKTNDLTAIVLHEAKNKFKKTVCNFEKPDDSTDCKIYLPNTQQYFIPGKFNDSDIIEDYALITRIRNPFNIKNFVFILAGCKAGAAFALEYFFSNNEVLERLYKNYYAEEHIQIILKVQYKYRSPVPEFISSDDIIEFEIIYPEGFNNKNNMIYIDNELVEKLQKPYLTNV